MDGKAGAVDDEMERLTGLQATIHDCLQPATSTGDSAVVRCWQLDFHDGKDRHHEAFGLAKG